jgi:hypothetical protein
VRWQRLSITLASALALAPAVMAAECHVEPSAKPPRWSAAIIAQKDGMHFVACGAAVVAATDGRMTLVTATHCLTGAKGVVVGAGAIKRSLNPPLGMVKLREDENVNGRLAKQELTEGDLAFFEPPPGHVADSFDTVPVAATRPAADAKLAFYVWELDAVKGIYRLQHWSPLELVSEDALKAAREAHSVEPPVVGFGAGCQGRVIKKGHSGGLLVGALPDGKTVLHAVVSAETESPIGVFSALNDPDLGSLLCAGWQTSCLAQKGLKEDVFHVFNGSISIKDLH